MKTRVGFISNSSSTSYITVLPDDFDVDKLFPKESEGLKKYIKRLHKNRYLDEESLTGQEDCDLWTIIGLLEPFVLEEISGGSDAVSSIIVLNNKSIKEILK